MQAEAKEFYVSSSGDRWLLERDTATGHAVVVHQANEPSGGAVTRLSLSDFLRMGKDRAEQQELLQLIGTLAG